MAIGVSFNSLKNYDITFLWLFTQGHCSKAYVAQNGPKPTSTVLRRRI